MAQRAVHTQPQPTAFFISATIFFSFRRHRTQQRERGPHVAVVELCGGAEAEAPVAFLELAGGGEDNDLAIRVGPGRRPYQVLGASAVNGLSMSFSVIALSAPESLAMAASRSASPLACSLSPWLPAWPPVLPPERQFCAFFFVVSFMGGIPPLPCPATGTVQTISHDAGGSGQTICRRTRAF